MTDSLSGVCRSIFVWTDNTGQLDLAFGTHATLQLWRGGKLFDITPDDLAAGQIDGTGSIGYGTGAYGVGAWNEPSATEYFPRTWSLAAWGQDLIASPRGGTIYQWDANDTGIVAAAVVNTPTNVTYSLVAPQDQVFALGCNEEVSGNFNALCIRHSGVRRVTEWATNAPADSTSREYILPGGGRIVAGRVIGSYLLVWTNAALFLGTYVGQLGQIWRFDKVGGNCGLIGPNAAVVVGQAAYWISPDRQFYTYNLGAAPQILPCTIRDDFADNLSASQGDKIVASSIAEFSEIRFDYPDNRDGVENSRYVSLSTNGQGWYRGRMARTAMVDAGPSLYPAGAAYDGHVYWHERGGSADGAPLSWFIESADQYLSEDRSLLMRTMWPDVQGQTGPVMLTLTSRFKPQGDETMKSYVIAPHVQKVDLRATGRLFRIKFAGSASPTAFRLGQPVIDAVATGAR